MRFCLRIIVNEKSLNLEKTTSICIVFNLNCDLVVPLGLILPTSMRKENLPGYILEILNSSFNIAFMIENKYFKQRQTLSSSILNQANHRLPRVCELRPNKIMQKNKFNSSTWFWFDDLITKEFMLKSLISNFLGNIIPNSDFKNIKIQISLEELKQLI